MEISKASGKIWARDRSNEERLESQPCHLLPRSLQMSRSLGWKQLHSSHDSTEKAVALSNSPGLDTVRLIWGLFNYALKCGLA